MATDVREYQSGDREKLLFMDSEDGKPLSKRRAQKIRAVECLEAFYAYVAEENGKIVGFIIMEDLGDDTSYYMVQINVLKKRKGVGRQLVRAVFEVLGPGCHVSLCVNTDNEAAIAFYKSLGFKQSGFTEGYRRNQNKYWYQIDL